MEVVGFHCEVNGNDIKNTWVETAVGAPILVEKQIVGAEPETPDTFTFTLTPTNNGPMPQSAQAQLQGAGETSFGTIRFESPGTYTYQIQEVAGAANCKYDETIYLLTIVVEKTGNKLQIVSTSYQVKGGSALHEKPIFTNYYLSQNEMNLSVQKFWAGKVNPNQPESIEVQLYKNGVAEGDPVALNVETDWKTTWYGLDKTATWTVDEPNLPQGYSKNISGNATSGFAILNTYNGDATLGDGEIVLTGIKTWEHGANPAENQPQSITVYAKDGDRVVQTAVVTAQDNWQYSFQLPQYRVDGKTKIAYTIDEEAIAGYKKTASGTNLINTYTGDVVSGDETVLVNGSKIWNHKSNPEKDCPSSITVYIKDGATVVASAEITQADQWQWSFQLPKYRADGKTAIVYTVDEAAVTGYGKTVVGSNLINTFGEKTPGESEILLAGTKTWQYEDAPESDRPASVTVLVKNGSKTVKSIVVSKETNWTWACTLPKYDAQGKAIYYTIDEENVPHYKKTINGFNLKNTYAGADYPGDSPKTGDTNNGFLWACVAVCSGCWLLCLLASKKSRQQRYQSKYSKR